MASNTDTLYITYVDVYQNLLKIWGQKNRIGASYIERQLLHLAPELNKTPAPISSRIQKGMLCYVQCSEDNYYRARIISNLQNDLVGVIFVDVGNKDMIHVSQIRLIEGNEDVLLKMAEQAEEYCLADVIAPAGGWTKKGLNEIRHHICNKELFCKEVCKVGDQKLLEIQFQNESLASFLINKQVAEQVPLNIQSQIILSYSGLEGNNVKQDTLMEDFGKTNFLACQSQPDKITDFKISQKDLQVQNNYSKLSNAVNFSQVPLQYPYTNSATPSTMTNVRKTSPSNAYSNSQSPAINENFVRPVKPFHPNFSNKNNPAFHVKERSEQWFDPYNNGMVEALHQLAFKQYLTEGNSKSAQYSEIIPHNYVNSVLEVGSTHKVFISCIDDGPWSFSVQLISAESELNSLMQELSYTELLPIKPPIVLGHPCIGASSYYENLCRGVVVSISHSAVKVYFVDFGNTEDLPVSSIYELPHKFFKTRVLSQKFCLSGLQKVTYSDEIKEHFNEVVQDKLLILRVASLEGDNLPSCDLFIKEVNIKKILNDRIRNSRLLNDPNPNIGDTENVVVTWVDSLQKFFVQLHKRDPQLTSLKNELAQVDFSGQKLNYEEVKIGLKCVCKYILDGQWYRTVIMSFSSEDKITVFYFDYGNIEEVDISLLRKVSQPGLISQLNNQAIQCCLDGFQFKTHNHVLSNEFQNLVLEKDLKMSVISSDGGQLCVKLFVNDEDVVSLLLNSCSQEKQSIEKSSNESDSWIKQKNISVKNQQNFSSKVEKKTYKKSDSYDKSSYKTFLGEKNRRGGEVKEGDEGGNWREEKRKIGNENFTRNDKYNRGQNENYWKDRKIISNNENSLEHFGKNDRTSNTGNDRFSANKPLKKTTNKKSFPLGKDSEEQGKRIDRNEEIKFEKKKFNESEFDKSKFATKKFPNFEGEKFKGIHTSVKNSFEDRESNNTKEIVTNHHNKAYLNVKLKQPMNKDDVAPEGSKFEERIVKNESCEKVIITYYINPDEFYIQLLSNEEDFKKMMQEIQIYYSDKYPISHQPKVGDIVIAQFSYDNVLYRGEVVKHEPLIIRYADYGNQEEVELTRIWQVAKKFLSLPKQVVRCKLANVQPIGSEWPLLGSKLDQFFESEEYRCTFLGVNSDIYEIDLVAIDSDKDVATEIIAHGCGTTKEPKISIPDIDFSLLSKQVLKVHVSHVQSPYKFYVILNPDFVKLIEQEIQVYVDNKEFLKPLNDVSLNSQCLITCDGVSWLRGTVLNIEDSNISVYLNDRGDVVNVSPDKIKSLPEYLKRFQSQAVECCLEEPLSSVSADDFKTCILSGSFLMYVASEDNKRLSVLLYDHDGNISDYHIKNKFPQHVEAIGQLPIITQEIPVLISHIESFEEIYLLRQEDIYNFEIFTDKLTNFYQDTEECKFDGNEGAFVAAKSLSQQSWLRAQILSISSNNAEVFYIDSGKKENLPIENVKNLDSSFYETHSYVRKVSLDVKNASEISKETLSKFKELVGGKTLLGYFINDKGTFLSEFIIDGCRITSLLNLTYLPPDKFEKILPKNKLLRQGNKNSSSCKNHSENLKVIVVHIDSPKKFWVHKECSINDLQKFQQKLNMSCETSPDEQYAEINEIVGALFDEVWYRAIILNIEENILTVKFIDYGNVLEIDLSCHSIKKLTDDIKSVPTFATQFALKGDFNKNATAKFEEIIMDCEDPVTAVILEESDPIIVDLLKDGQSISESLIQDKINENNELDTNDFITVYITHCNSPDDFYVQRESSTEALESISNRLLEADSLESAGTVQENKMYAAKYSEDDLWYRAKVLKKEQEYIEVIFVDYGNISKVNEIKELPLDLTEIPWVCENYSLINQSNSNIWSKEACEKFTEYADGRPLKMKIIETQKVKPMVELYFEETDVRDELERLCENDQRSRAYICHVNSPIDFYIRFVQDDNFDIISKEIAKLYEHSKELEERVTGVFCLSYCKEDGKWHRAKILRVLEEGCEVLLLDIGKLLISNNLKTPISSIVDIPPRALRCTLKLHDKNIPESVKEEFINLTSKSKSSFHVRIITPGDINVVSLKVDGRVVEQVLSMESNTEMAENTFPNLTNLQDSCSALEDETDDDKNSKKLKLTENYLCENLNSSILAGNSLCNETDEEKRFKIAIGTSEVGGSNGFKSDDEKGKFEVLSNLVNATDNDLTEEFNETAEENFEHEFNKITINENSTNGKSPSVENLDAVEEITEKTGENCFVPEEEFSESIEQDNNEEKTNGDEEVNDTPCESNNLPNSVHAKINDDKDLGLNKSKEKFLDEVINNNRDVSDMSDDTEKEN